MPMNFNPHEVRKQAGTFNKDMKAPRSKGSKTSTKLNGGSPSVLKEKVAASAYGNKHGLAKKCNESANFTTDADMGLKTSGGKSGKY